MPKHISSPTKKVGIPKARLGISRTIVSDRMKHLVEEGALKRVLYRGNPTRFESRLTETGMELNLVVMAIVHRGDRHHAGRSGPPLLHRHKARGHDVHAVRTCSECGEVVDARSVETRPGPGSAE